MTVLSSTKDDLFNLDLIRSYVNKELNPRFVERHWLKQQVEDKLAAPDCRFLLLTAEPGAGKSAFIAWLAHQHPDWCRYFIRRDQRTPLGDAGSYSFLLQVGFQLAATYPHLFKQEQIKIVVEQRIGTATNSEIVGAEIAKMFASPFYEKVIQIQQQVTHSKDTNITGVRVGEFYASERDLPIENLQFMALFDPAKAMMKQVQEAMDHPQRQIVVLVDALDELRYQDSELSLLKWLTNCPELPANLRFVLTCRPDDDLLRAFRGTQQGRIQEISIAEEDPDVIQDLTLYTRFLIETPEVNQTLSEMCQDLDEFTHQAITKANGNFGYLGAIGRAVDEAIRQNQQELLREILKLSKLPDTLQDLYAFFLSKIKDAVAKEKVPVEDAEGEIGFVPVWSAVYKPILGILAVALEPLTPTQIQKLGLIQAEFDYVTGAIEKLQQFLDRVGNCYRLYHNTLPEFFTSSKTKERTDYSYCYVDAIKQHQRIVDYYMADEQPWHSKPTSDRYLWHHLAYHLSGASKNSELRALLFNFDWLQAKLDATDVNALIADFDFLSNAPDVSLVQSTIRLSAHILDQDKTQLPGQLLGRLLSQEIPEIQVMLAHAQPRKAVPWLRPLSPSLSQPGGPLLRTLEGHTGSVFAVAINPNGEQAVSASADCTLKVWDLNNGKTLQTLKGHTGGVLGLAITPDEQHVISASADRTLQVWDLESGKTLQTLKGHTGAVWAVAITPNGQQVVSASDDRTLKIWDLESGTVVRTLEGHSDVVRAVAITQDGQRLVSASDDSTLKVWDSESGAILHTLNGHTKRVFAVAVANTPNGKRVISASADHTLRVWDLESGTALHTLEGHSDWVRGIAVLPGEQRVVSVSDDKTLKVWDLESGIALCTLEGHTNGVRGVAITHKAGQIVSASDDQILKVWDLENKSAFNLLEGHTDRVWAVAITPDQHLAISASDDRTLRVWNLQNRTPLHILEGHTKGVRAVAVIPETSWIVSGSDDCTLKVWDLQNGTPLRTLEGHTNLIRAVAVTPDGTQVVSASADCTLKVWDLERGTAIHTLAGHTDWVRAVAVTPDGTRVVSASADRTLKVWDLERGTAIHTLEGHTDRVWAVAVMPQGNYAISASGDCTLKVWDLQDGIATYTLQGHNSPVLAVSVALQGRLAISTSHDRTLKVWDLKSRTAIANWGSDGSLLSCAVASDGVTLVAGEVSGRVHFLRIEGTHLLD
ncbi:WD40 repeat domain-containing protein [Microcoleus sp. FACHB-SPT15]|uniref:WD40 repeat domain-containing protein n=1 Tax=Microcoleus sp. FACHB-SPT15 TaxID=2692830 RepID=UPI0018EFAEE6|nr:hypothetical protein [Microcoleus sp. FACHB-SPT15]